MDLIEVLIKKIYTIRNSAVCRHKKNVKCDSCRWNNYNGTKLFIHKIIVDNLRQSPLQVIKKLTPANYLLY